MNRSSLMKSALGAVLLVTGAAAAADGPADSVQATLQALNAAGYGDVRDIEMDDGLWEAEVRSADGRWYDLHVVPGTGEVLDRNSGGRILNAREIVASLEAAGYTSIDDVELDEAVWDVDAVAPDGRDVDLRINGFDGQILVSELDD